MAEKKKKTGATAPVMIRVSDGTRELMKEGVQLLFRLLDGNQKERVSRFLKKPVLRANVPFFDNLGDRYTVVVSAEKYLQAGFTPIAVKPGVVETVDLMLLPRNNTFNFRDARWESLKETHGKLARILTQGVSEHVARDRYTQLMENQAPSLAAMLNITTALDALFLPSGTPLDYFKALIWDDPQAAIAPDRFFGFADTGLMEQLRLGEQQGILREEPLPGLFHPGATRSYKQVQFGEANVQLTLHETTKSKIDGVDCVKVEADMDYYKDPLAHALLEVLPNRFGGGTDPRQVYVLRWIAGRRAGVPEFNPPYTIVEA